MKIKVKINEREKNYIRKFMKCFSITDLSFSKRNKINSYIKESKNIQGLCGCLDRLNELNQKCNWTFQVE